MSDDVRAAFDRYDEDGNGRIDSGEFRKILESLGERLEPNVADALFGVIDTDENGEVDYDEFALWWTTR